MKKIALMRLIISGSSKIFLPVLALSSSLLVGCYDNVAMETRFGIANQAPPCESVPYSSLKFPSNLILVEPDEASSSYRLELLRIARIDNKDEAPKYVYTAEALSSGWTTISGETRLHLHKNPSEALNPEIRWRLASSYGRLVFCNTLNSKAKLAFSRSDGGDEKDGWGAVGLKQGSLLDPNALLIEVGYLTKKLSEKARENPSAFRIQAMHQYRSDLPGDVVTYNPENSAAALDLINYLNFKPRKEIVKKAIFVTSCVDLKSQLTKLDTIDSSLKDLNCEKYPW